MSDTNNARRIKVGVVGCGVVATAYYLPWLMRHAELVALCDNNPRRLAICQRLFGAHETYTDYSDMLAKADIEAVFILTGPAPHTAFSVAAANAGKHILLQKPMCLTMPETNAIVDAVRRNGVKALIEPSSHTLMDPAYAKLRGIIDRGVLGAPYWFSYVPTAGDTYHPSLGGNPYGLKAFFSEDSGGMLFDFPYAPSMIATLLGDCKSVTATANIAVPERNIVPDSEYDRYLETVTDPDNANYWDVVLDLPKSERIEMGAPDNVFSLYEMDSGATGVFHVGKPFHPMPPGVGGPGLEIFGRDGNVILGRGKFASVISSHKDLLPEAGPDGWLHIPVTGDPARTPWPRPTVGGFHYYHESSAHFCDCIREDRDPSPNVEWGRHINEMMIGAIESARTGRRYEMTSTSTGLR
jgi:predicted dehydrogenase